jgi:hypothetical protein
METLGNVLLVGLLMGIRAVKNFGIDTDKAASAYRLHPKHRPSITKEQLKQWQLESAAYAL